MSTDRAVSNGTSKHSSCYPQSDEDIEQFRSDWGGLSKDELLEKYGVRWRTLEHWASDFGATRRSTANKERKETLHYINRQNYFPNKNIPSYEELIKLALQETNVLEDYYFTPTITENEIVTDNPVALVFTADWHLGSLGVDYLQFDKDIKLMEMTEGLFCYIGGDLRENIIQASKVGSGHNQQQIIRQDVLFERVIEKLQDKIVAIGCGNHDWDRQLTGVDRIAGLARDLKIVYTDQGGLMNLTVGNQLYKIYRAHHSKYNSSFNLTHSAKQSWRMGEFDADIMVLEHRHEGAVEPFYGHGLERMAVRVGTYKIKDDYARAYSFYGQRIANPTLILYPDCRRMVPFLHMEDAIEHLKIAREKEDYT